MTKLDVLFISFNLDVLFISFFDFLSQKKNNNIIIFALSCFFPTFMGEV